MTQAREQKPNSLPVRAAETPIPYTDDMLIFERSRPGRRGASMPEPRGTCAIQRSPSRCAARKPRRCPRSPSWT